MFNDNAIIRKYIRFYGRVKGVGFRGRAREAAELFEVTGWLRSEGEDSVSMELQGTKKNIKKFISYMESGPKIRVDNIKSKDITPDPSETSFRTVS